MSITSTTLFVTVTLAALVLPVLLVAVRRRTRPSWARTVSSWGVIVLAQVLAIAAVGLHLNREYGFYSSWADTLGVQEPQAVTIATGGIDGSAAGSGTTRTFTVSDPRAGSAQAVAWLPPGYDSPANAHRRYPVMVVLPGYSNTVGSTYENLHIGTTASQLVDSGRARPFIVVVAPYQTVQGRDTECTNVRGGAPEFDFLTRTVPKAIRSTFRAAADTDEWSALGWSTGGYCAAKALYASPSPWRATASVGGYFEAVEDDTTGHLYPTRADRARNSPIDLYRRYEMPSTRLLIVSSRTDHEAFRSSARMAHVARNDSHVSSLWLPSGGHNYATYQPHLDEVMLWALTAPPQA